MQQEVRYALRLLRKSPNFTIVVVLTLALAIGANTAVFSIVHGVLLRPLPYRNPERLVGVLDSSLKNPNLSKTFGTYADFEEASRHSALFEKTAFVSWATGGLTMTGRGRAKNVLGIPVTKDFFTLLGVNAIRGRSFEDDDAKSGCTVVVSHDFWRDSLGARDEAIGQALTLDHRSCKVVGVTPVDFEFFPRGTQLWLLLAASDARPRDQLVGATFGRLQSGVTIGQVEAALRPAHVRNYRDGWHRDFVPVVGRLQDEFIYLASRNLKTTLLMLLGAVGLVLLIGCLNVAGLLLNRASTRSRDIAVRTALGADRRQLMWPLLAESAVLAAGGGTAGVGIAAGLMRYFVAHAPIDLPAGSKISMSLPVLGFTALVTIATALLVGLLPALKGSPRLGELDLRAAGRGSIQNPSRRLMQGLVAGEIALALLLLGGTSLLTRSLFRLSSTPIGYDFHGVEVMSAVLPEEGYGAVGEKLAFYDRLERELSASPGIETVALATTLPPYGSGLHEVEVDGVARTGVQDVGENVVSAGYFETLRIRLVAGRVFDRRDRHGSAPVAVINEALARKYFVGVNPIGRRIRSFEFREGPWATVIGVVATEKHPNFLREMEWQEEVGLYRPLGQAPPGYISVAVRRKSGSAPRRDIQAVLTEIDPEIAAGEVAGLETLLARHRANPEFRALVVAQFTGLALLLAMLGLYGLLSQFVNQRTRDLGVRRALGASTADIVKLVGMQAGVPALAGLATGIVATHAMARYLSSLLFDVSALDVVNVALAVAASLVTALFAAARPMLRATSIDPGIALRDE